MLYDNHNKVVIALPKDEKMKIDTISIQNYRLLKDMTIELEDTLSLVIGKNNTGKTSLSRILNSFLGDYPTPFKYEDFSIEIQQELTRCNAETPLSEDLFLKKIKPISLEIQIGYDDNDNIGFEPSLILDLDDHSHQMIMRCEWGLSYKRYLKLSQDYCKIHKEQTSITFIDYIKENLAKYCQKTVFKVDPTDKAHFEPLPKYDTRQIIRIATIDAKRDVANNEHSQTLSRLASEFYTIQNRQESPSQALVDLHNTIKESDKTLGEKYGDFFSDIISDIRRTSYSANESTISVKSHLQEENLFRDNTVVTYMPNDDAAITLPEDYNGLGYMNLFAIIFSIRIKIDQLLANKAPLNLLFLEEPEAHTHPQMQYAFIRHISDLLSKYSNRTESDSDGDVFNLQSILTSHSPQIVSQCDFNAVKYFRRSGDSTEALNLSDLKTRMAANSTATEQEESRAYRFVKQYITLEKAEIFFADKAILFEGDTERILMPAMMKKLDDQMKGSSDSLEKQQYEEGGYLLSQDIVLLQVGAFSQHFKELLDFLGIKTLIITDFDAVSKTKSANKSKPKSEREGEEKGERSHSVDPNGPEADHTSNTSLNFFFDNPTVQKLESLSPENKILSSSDRGKTWLSTDGGNLRIAFQTREDNYQPRSFEDAFLAQGSNLDFINNHLEAFQTSLKGSGPLKVTLSNGVPDYYSVTRDRIDNKHKTNFALCLLLCSNEDGSWDWATPDYIEEGLLWLQR